AGRTALAREFRSNQPRHVEARATHICRFEQLSCLRCSGSYRALIFGEEFCVLDRTVMMYLAPATVDQLKNSRRADVEILLGGALDIGAALAPHRPKHVANPMDRVIPENNVNVGGAFEDPFVHPVRLTGASTNSTERIVDRNAVRGSEVVVQHVEIA